MTDPAPAAASHRRGFATALLVVMVAAFIASSLLKARYPLLAYVCAFTEAATVGATADWFAVTALFRHPFGIPIPHTAIIARNKQRIGEALGRFICNNFLAPEVVAARLDHFDAAGWTARWLSDPAHRLMVVRQVSGALPVILEMLGTERVREFARGAIRGGIDSVAVAPLAARTLTVLADRGQEQQLLDFALGAGKDWLARNKDAVRARVAQNSGSWMPDWVDGRLTDRLVTGVLGLLTEMRDPAHPYRADFSVFVRQLAERLAHDPGLYEQCERVKSGVLDSTVVESYVGWLGREAGAWLSAEKTRPDSLLLSGVDHALQVVAEWLREDEPIRTTLNQSLRDAVLATVVPNRTEIGDFIAAEVARWDSSTIVARVENQLGEDLQFIRFNGTVVGGLVGLVIFVVQKLMGAA